MHTVANTCAFYIMISKQELLYRWINMISKEKCKPLGMVKTDDNEMCTEAAVSYQNLRYFIIISATLFTIMMASFIILAPDALYVKAKDDSTNEDGGQVLNNVTFTAGNDAYINITLKDGNEVCTSPDCVQAAARLSNYMDTDVSPCQDFYQYSCGGWEKTHSIPSEQEHWDIFGELAQKNYNYFLNLLSTEPNQNDSDALIKAKRIFLACNNSKQIVDDELEAIRYIINITGGWDRTNITQNKTWSINSNLPLERYHASFAFFGFSIRADDYNSTKPDIEVNCMPAV